MGPRSSRSCERRASVCMKSRPAEPRRASAFLRASIHFKEWDFACNAFGIQFNFLPAECRHSIRHVHASEHAERLAVHLNPTRGQQNALHTSFFFLFFFLPKRKKIPILYLAAGNCCIPLSWHSVPTTRACSAHRHRSRSSSRKSRTKTCRHAVGRLLSTA